MDKRPPITLLNNINAVHIHFKEIKAMDNHTSFISWDSPADVYALAFAVNDEILHETTSLLSYVTTAISLNEDEQLFYGILCLKITMMIWTLVNRGY